MKLEQNGQKLRLDDTLAVRYSLNKYKSIYPGLGKIIPSVFTDSQSYSEAHATQRGATDCKPIADTHRGAEVPLLGAL